MPQNQWENAMSAKLLFYMVVSCRLYLWMTTSSWPHHSAPYMWVIASPWLAWPRAKAVCPETLNASSISLEYPRAKIVSSQLWMQHSYHLKSREPKSYPLNFEYHICITWRAKSRNRISKNSSKWSVLDKTR